MAQEEVKVTSRKYEELMTARAVSMILAVIADASVIWLLYFRSGWNPPAGEAEWFWVRTFIFGGLYVIVQQWTQSKQTGGQDNTTASLDKLLAASPAAVVLGLELYWLGHDGNLQGLSWRHHTFGAMMLAYSVVDYMTTDILNQRLSAREMKMSSGT